MSLDGYIRPQGPFRPLNDNPKAYQIEAEYVKGSPLAFLSIDDFVAFHPNKMKQGTPYYLINYPNAGNRSEYFLRVDPSELLDGSGDSILTTENFTDYFQLSDTKDSGSTRVYEYAPNKSGGGKPSFPYTPSTEATDNWTPVYDASKGHKWVRWRTDDVDANEDGVYDNWTVPLALEQSFMTGDYIENRFIRQDVDLTERTSSSGLEVDKYYIVKAGTVVVNSVNYTTGKVFQHKAGNSYTFSSATVQETVPAPAFTKADGTLNNEPSGYTDTPPVGSEMLWQIEAQKSVYGQLKSEWRIKRIIENPQYVRYSHSPTPLPSSVCGINDDASTGQAGDTALNNAGWVAVYNNHSYIAIREDDNGGSAGPPFTQWTVEKINEESGEYTDRVFKLYDSNLPVGSVLIVKPTQADAIKEGFFDTPQAETSNKINYIFEARKFYNGELKGEWSDGVPYTGKAAYLAEIISNNDNNFKIDPNDGSTIPDEITLTAQLFKGVEKLWEKDDVILNFEWTRVYNNGNDDTDADSDSEDDFYYLPSTGTIGTSGYKWSAQRLVVKPDGVDGKAIFRCTITVTMDEGDDLVFPVEFSIVDVADGLDAKILDVSADNQLTIYDNNATAFVPSVITLRARHSNLVSPTFKWFRWTGAAWTEITTGGAYVVSGGTMIITASGVFAGDNTAEEELYAVTNHTSNPDSADDITTFTDKKTIAKVGAAAVGSPGENAAVVILDNESATMILDKATGSPIAGETGSSGRIVTGLELWDGNTKKVYGGGNDYTVAVSPNSGDIQFAVQADGNDALIYISQWNSTTAKSAVCTATITYGAKTFTKKFQISTTEDAPGALILDMDSDKGFQFSPADQANKTLTANLFDTSEEVLDDQLQTSGYEYRWKKAGVWTSWSSTRTTTLTRANVKVSEDVTLEVRPGSSGSAIRSTTQRFSDIVDFQQIIMQTDAASANNSNKLSASKTDNSTVTVSGVTWRASTDSYWNTNTPTYDCIGYEDPSDITKYIWTNPRRIKGEAGDQGNSGDFYFDMYKVDGSSLPNGTSSTLAQMTGAGWKSTEERPTSGAIWHTSRRWNGEGVSFDANGYPDTDPSAGSKWSAPVLITGAEGDPGDPGDPGDQGEKGWAPSLAVVADGERRVHRLIDWVGGEGTKPGNVGEYLGASGFEANIANAVDIRGAQGPQGDDLPLKTAIMVSPASTASYQWLYIDRGASFSTEPVLVQGFIYMDNYYDYIPITIRSRSTAFTAANQGTVRESITIRTDSFSGEQIYLPIRSIIPALNHRYIAIQVQNTQGNRIVRKLGLSIEKISYSQVGEFGYGSSS